MAELDGLGIALARLKQIADGTVLWLREHGVMDWRASIQLSAHQWRSDEESGVTVIGPSHHSILNGFGFRTEGWGDLSVEDLVKNPFMAYPSSNPEYSDEMRRTFLAEQGVWARPVLAVPLGEIVNGCLTRLKALDDAGVGDD